jgi:alkanesulfonate monooxygenase SsuD/methylene tetrahydromethanopterin reductase-like flavin-dependent oxidoreductase (luciferase family)
MKAIWTEDEAEYHGEQVDFDPVWSWPKPVQKPHPPVLVGGNSEAALRRVIRFGDGWMPNPETRLSQLPGRIEELQRMAGEAGRDRIPVTFYALKPDLEALERYAEAGVDRGLFLLPPASREELEAALDHYTKLGQEFGAL